MKLKRLDIIGFKSFNEKVSIDLPPGISAIVGPNGCGKSNIMDAIRWVMGEQSVKQLRGKNMEDIIFSGTKDKPAINIAEVSMTLSNEDGSGPEELKDFTEIQLTRRIYRSGERIYLINKQPCRLKDIHNIFWGSGMGSKSYSVIQQGNIGAITEAGPQERRFFVEEAAGVTRYKNRKKETLGKIETTKSNLLRIDDIISEIERQMSSLKRQANKAEQYKKYKKKILNLDVQISIVNYDSFSKKIKQTDILLKDLKIEDTSHTSSLGKIDSEIEDIKFERSRKQEEISLQEGEKFNLQRNIDKHENDLAHCRSNLKTIANELKELEPTKTELENKNKNAVSEITQIENENQGLIGKIKEVKSALEQEQKDSEGINSELLTLNKTQESCKARLMDIVAQEARLKNICQNTVRNKETIQRRLKRADEQEAVAVKNLGELENNHAIIKEDFESLKQEIKDLNEQINIFGSQVDKKRSLLAKQVKSVQTTDLNLNKIKSKYNALKKMEKNFQWYKDGVKAVFKAQTKRNDLGQVLCITSDIIVPESGFETAVEGVLGESLQYIIVEDQKTCINFIEYLKNENAGRSGFISIDSIKLVNRKSEKISDPLDQLLDHVAVKKGYEKIAEALLGNVLIASDIQQAKNIHKNNPSLQTIVTKDGHVISDQGIMIGGSKEQLSGILAKKQELRQIEKQISDLTKNMESERKEQKEMESELRELETQLQQQIANKKNAQQDEINSEKKLYKITQDLKHERRHLEIIQLEQDQLVGEADDTDNEMTRYDQALSEIESEVLMANRQVAETSEKIESISLNMATFNKKILDIKVKLTSLNAKLENGNNTLKRLKEFNDHRVKQLEQVTSDILRKSDKNIENKEKIKTYEQTLPAMYEELETLEQLLETNKDEFLSLDNSLKEHDSFISDIQNKREQLSEKIRLLDLEQSKRLIKQENIANRIKEQYHKSIFKFKEELTLFPDKDNSKKSVPEMEQELTQYRDKILKITDVNLNAIKEYNELKERYDFLHEQKKDLVKAIADLYSVIKKINQITQEKFMQTFDQINQKLGEVFPRLFEGGLAKLVLTEPNKPLESGVELMIHPPGKKLTILSLLSGGEKAMSAIAFIFSIFLIKPASFCLMDEIDAPLDDANIDRFNNLLQIIGEKSQIIMITHNKHTMEFADTLFGVTMETKGISKVVSVNFEKM